MSPELDTLDQLLGGNMSLKIIRQIFPNDEGFTQGVLGLLRDSDVRLLVGGEEVPRWQWRALFEGGDILGDLRRFDLEITEQGLSRIS